MTCKDAINSDTSSEDKELYFLSENGSYNKDFKFNLESTTDQKCLRSSSVCYYWVVSSNSTN